MCGDEDGFLKGDVVRDGFVKPLDRPWKKISYAEVDGRAVFEGCIILGEAEKVKASARKLAELADEHPALLTKPKAEHRGIGILGQQYRWPRRTIPFTIDPDVANPQRVHDAIAHWEQRTTIRFRPRTDERDYVRVKRVTSGCASEVGRQGGEQELVLRDSCTLGNIIHELGHTIGLWHEQSRADRKNYVEILYDNIDPAAHHNFKQQILDGVDLNAYDYGSIMHYPAFAASFALDTTQPVIRALKTLPQGVVMGQRSALSAGDIAAVEKMYELEPMPL